MMAKLSNWQWWAIMAIVIAVGLRCLDLGKLPAGLNRDEAALAYNAYLLTETGHDEWQRPWPLALESFGDFKLIGYPLASIPFIKLFGLTDAAIRIPSAIAGVELVVLTMLWAQRLWPRQPWWSVGVAAMVALTPIWVFYSRWGFEANLALAYLIAATWWWWQPTRLTRTQALWGAVWWFLATITYNTPLLLTPVLISATVVWYGWRAWRQWLIPALMMMVISGVVLTQLLPLTKQKSSITIFSDPTVTAEWLSWRTTLPANLQTWAGKKPVYLLKVMTEHSVASLSPKFLVQQGGTHPWHQLPGFGHLSLAAILKKGRHGWAFGLLWLGGLLPAIVTVDAPHATRSLLSIWIWSWLGWWALAEWGSTWVKNHSVVIVVTGAVAIQILATTSYWWSYWQKYPAQSAQLVQAGLANTLNRVDPAQTQAIAIVDPDGYLYIVAAWYQRLPAAEFYQTQVRQLPNSIGFRYGEKVGRYHFIAKPQDPHQAQQVISWDGQQWQVLP
jgi:hypothetical protein